MPNVLTDFAKTSVCACRHPPGRPPTVPLGAARGCGGPVSPACAARGHARHHRPRGLRRSTITPRRYRSSGRETGRHHRVWREARPPLCARDHGAPRERHRPDTRCHRVDRGKHRRATPGERQTIAALVNEAARGPRARKPCRPPSHPRYARPKKKKKDLRPKCSRFCFF